MKTVFTGLRLLAISCTMVLASSALTACSTASAAPYNYAAYQTQFDNSNAHTEHTLTRNDGHTINARQYGAQFKGQQPTLVLMHGFPDNQHLYDLLVPKLASTRHVVTFDFLGWGKSQSPAGKTYPVSVQTQDLQTVIDQLSLNMVELVVHDLSGQPGIDWALDNPTKVAKLVLLNTYYSSMPTLKAPEAIEFYSKPGLITDIARWGANKAASRFEAGVASQLDKFMVTDSAKQTFIPLFAYSAAYMRPAFFSSVSYLWQEIDARQTRLEQLKNFEKPVTIIFGKEDPYLNPGVANDFGKLFKNSRVTLVANAGHYVQLDNASAVADLIR